MSVRPSIPAAALLIASCGGGGGDDSAASASSFDDEAAEPAVVVAPPTSVSAPAPGSEPEESAPVPGPEMEPVPEPESPVPGSTPGSTPAPDAERDPEAASPEAMSPVPTESTPAKPEPPTGPAPGAEPGPDAPVEAELETPPDTSAAASLPADCLIATADDGTTYCYSSSTRELMAVRADGQTYWRFTLPGNDSINDVRSITLAQGYLVILAATRGDAGPAVEFSTFEPSGAFVATHVLEREQWPSGASIDASNVALYGTARALYVSAALVADGAARPVGTALHDSVLARYDASSGTLEALRGTAGDRVRELTAPAGPDAPLSVRRDGAAEGIDPWLLSPSTTPLVNTDTWQTHLLLASGWLEARYLTRALERIETILPSDPSFNGPGADCPDGGSVELRGFANRVSERRTVYRKCANAGALIDGTVVESFGQQDGGGTRSNSASQTYEGFSVRLGDDADTTFEIDATVGYLDTTTRYQCLSSSTSWSTNVARFSEVSDRATFEVSSSQARQTRQTQSGPAQGSTAGCQRSESASASASASVSPPFAPDTTLSIRFDDPVRDGSDQVQLAVRAPDGSSVVSVGPLDGGRPDRTSWGSNGGRTEVLTLLPLRPDLTAASGQ